MKKLLSFALVLAMLALVGCGGGDARAEDGAIEIGDKLFIQQVNEIKTNYEDYVGETIRYEGIYEEYEYLDSYVHYILRNGPGCCGDDGAIGFEVAYDGEWPQNNDWVLAEGVLESYELNNWYYLRLNLSRLEVLDVRGQEYVDN